MTSTTTYCDVCNIMKEQTNHWWTLLDVLYQDRTRLLTFVTNSQLRYSNHYKNILLSQRSYDCCGAECALRLVSRLMSETTGESWTI